LLDVKKPGKVSLGEKSPNVFFNKKNKKVLILKKGIIKMNVS